MSRHLRWGTQPLLFPKLTDGVRHKINCRPLKPRKARQTYLQLLRKERQAASFESSAITQLDLSFAFPAQQNVTVNGSLSDLQFLALPDSPIHVSGTCLDMNINVSTPTAITIINVTQLNASAPPGTVGIGAGDTFLAGLKSRSPEPQPKSRSATTTRASTKARLSQ